MKNVAFHSNQLGIRGTEVALYDYAHYNETILGNKSYIVSDANSNLETLKKFQNRFDVFLYNKFEDCSSFIKDKKITNGYFIKAGDNDGKLFPGTINAIHAVFQNKDVHGDRYAYVSEWLAKKMDMPNDYVPHIVWLPTPTQNYRKKLNIPEGNIVLGRHGGYNDFDLPFVTSAIYEIAKLRTDITFLFMNTKPFCSDLPNIIYVNGTYNLQNKANFINTCDYMIHARQHGESFGLAIGEFLFNDKPVISWKGGLDSNHLIVLGDKGLWYNDYSSVFDLLSNLKPSSHVEGTYKHLVDSFTPKSVMRRFNDLFL